MPTPPDESKSHPPEGSPPPAKPSWIESLAQRSAGLPESGQEKPAAQESEPNPWRYAGLGMQFAASIALMVALGWWIDRQMGWTNNAALVTCASVGVIGNLYLLIREAIRANQDESGPAKPKPDPRSKRQ